MSVKRILLLCAAVMLLARPGMAVAASDVFMCLSGISGGSADEEFQDCSEIVGVSYSVGLDGADPSSGSVCGLYVVSKAIDVGSVPLLIRSLLGRPLSRAA